MWFDVGLVFFSVTLLILIVPSVALGPPYVPTGRDKVVKLVQLVLAKPPVRAVDLGSGDGRIVIALAQAGFEAHGYETNPLLVMISRRKIKRLGLNNKAHIHWQNFWKADLSQYDTVFLFGLTKVMAALEKKLQKELRPSARVFSYIFSFPEWPVLKKEDSIYVYEKMGSIL